jgi:DNA-binding YbaB/EbfC family protein
MVWRAIHSSGVKIEEVTTVANIQKLMKQAQKMQEQMMRAQEELASKTVEATAGGGMVTAVVNGKFELVSLSIEKEVVDPDDIEMLQDLIVAAVNEGVRKAQEMSAAEMSKITGGLNLNIPGLT